MTLQIENEDITRLFEALDRDQVLIDEVREKVAASGDAVELQVFQAETLLKYEFPAMIRDKFPSLELYKGDTTGVGEGNRATGSEEQWACICSLAVQTTAISASIANGERKEETVQRATAMLTQYQKRGNTLFGFQNPAKPLNRDHVVKWGDGIRNNAPDPESMGASYLTMVIHDLTKVKAIVGPLAEKHRDLNEEMLTAKFVESVAEGSWPGHERLTDIKNCKKDLRDAIVAGFKTGFNASQVQQGESTAVHGIQIAAFLSKNPNALWFMDHFMLDTAGILGKPHKFTGTLIVDGYTFEPYTGYINRLLDARGDPQSCRDAHMDYHLFRLKMVWMDGGDGECEAAADLDSGVKQLSADLGVTEECMKVAFARTVEQSRTTTPGSARGLLRCWKEAADRFGPELMSGLVAEFNVTGLTASQPPTESPDAAAAAVVLEFSTKALNDAARGERWAVEVPILLGLLAVLWRCGRAAAMALFDAGEPRNPFMVTINPIAMRSAAKYAEAAGYTWLQWFHEIIDAYQRKEPLAPLLEKAVCSKELQLDFS
jgi:hypothetical protein